MRRGIGWLWIAGFFGLIATAHAQTASPWAANTQYDGTYAFVSATNVNETYMTTGTTHIGQCGNMREQGSLSIVNGQARYSSGKDHQDLYEGTVGSQGELAMRSIEPGKRAEGRVLILNGRIDGSGTVRARHFSNRCSYDLIWQKQSQ